MEGYDYDIPYQIEKKVLDIIYLMNSFNGIIVF